MVSISISTGIITCLSTCILRADGLPFTSQPYRLFTPKNNRSMPASENITGRGMAGIRMKVSNITRSMEATRFLRPSSQRNASRSSLGMPVTWILRSSCVNLLCLPWLALVRGIYTLYNQMI